MGSYGHDTDTEKAQEAYEAFLQDRREKDTLTFRHLEQRRRLNLLKRQEYNEHKHLSQEIQQDTQKYKTMLSELCNQRLSEFNRKHTKPRETQHQKQGKGRILDR